MARSRYVAALVADDHELYRGGLIHLLRTKFGFDDLCEVNTFEAALSYLDEHSCVSLATFEPAMSGMNGIASLRLVRHLYPTLPIAVITGSRQRDEMLAILATGVQGFVPKTFRAAQLEEALGTILDGHVFVPGEQRHGGVVERSALAQAEDTAAAGLTPRQRQVVRLIAQGKSNKEIARALHLAEGTIKVHVNALYRTLSVRNRASAVAAIAQHSWQQAS